MDNAAGLTGPGVADLVPSRSFGYRLWLLRHTWTRHMEAAIAPTALTHMQFFVLRAAEHLAGLGEVPSQTHIAEWLRTDCMTVSKVVRTLEAKGMLARAVHPGDPRAKGVATTAAGSRVLAQAMCLVHAEQERFFGRLGRDGKAAFSHMLDTLLEQDGAGGGRQSKEPT